MKQAISILLFACTLLLLGCSGAPQNSESTVPIQSTTADTTQQTVVPDKLIALTFDDGPNTNLLKMAETLQQHGAKATFFLIGKNINNSNSNDIKQVYNMGHEIGNHSWSHTDMSGMTADEIYQEYESVQAAVEQITGERPAFFRPPFLKTSDLMYSTIDLPFVGGISAADGTNENIAEDRAWRVISQAYDGAIALMHCSSSGTAAIDALHILIPELRSQGYEFVTVSELFQRMRVTPDIGSGILYAGTDTTK